MAAAAKTDQSARIHFLTTTQDNYRRAAQANNRMGRDWRTHAARVQPKDSNRAENERDPAQ
jgi:hypothetical protein